MNRDVWTENFALVRGPNFKLKNVQSVLEHNRQHQQSMDGEGTPNDTAYQFAKVFASPLNKHLNPVLVAQKKLEHERVKIKNLISNNPYKVRNYIAMEGDNTNNSLVPKKLLYQKLAKFDNDDDFIADFVEKMAKDKHKLAADKAARQAHRERIK